MKVVPGELGEGTNLDVLATQNLDHSDVTAEGRHRKSVVIDVDSVDVVDEQAREFRMRWRPPVVQPAPPHRQTFQRADEEDPGTTGWIQDGRQVGSAYGQDLI